MLELVSPVGTSSASVAAGAANGSRHVCHPLNTTDPAGGAGEALGNVSSTLVRTEGTRWAKPTRHTVSLTPEGSRLTNSGLVSSVPLAGEPSGTAPALLRGTEGGIGSREAKGRSNTSCPARKVSKRHLLGVNRPWLAVVARKARTRASCSSARRLAVTALCTSLRSRDSGLQSWHPVYRKVVGNSSETENTGTASLWTLNEGVTGINGKGALLAVVSRRTEHRRDAQPQAGTHKTCRTLLWVQPAPTRANITGRAKRAVALTDKGIVGSRVALNGFHVADARTVVPLWADHGFGLTWTVISRWTRSSTLGVLATPGTEESVKALLGGAKVEWRRIRRCHPRPAVVTHRARERHLSCQAEIIGGVFDSSRAARGTNPSNEAPWSRTDIERD